MVDADGIIYEGSDWNKETEKYDTWTEVPAVTPEDLGVEAVDDLTFGLPHGKAPPVLPDRFAVR